MNSGQWELGNFVFALFFSGNPAAVKGVEFGVRAVLGIYLGLGAVLGIDLGLEIVLEIDSKKNIAHFSQQNGQLFTLLNPLILNPLLNQAENWFSLPSHLLMCNIINLTSPNGSASIPTYNIRFQTM